ncbi:hypothetical protein M3182_14280 [Mesobacillus maritimus]|uniref:hypothetical protein n=1 Tax=Mesobacillus maritimus TaxID=1643336 RepID=UPI00203B16DD|nr:hypothetical protein [Mesobacillus maritimus]MCM3586902.1 hypothetical protein [Mesobacillus maritimus]MCM3668743.1 hypothetical protein [Mesobacillus maritimus]
MLALLVFMAITGVSLILALRKKKTIFLMVPFLSIFVYFLIQVIMVPAPFFETVRFIFSLS